MRKIVPLKEEKTNSIGESNKIKASVCEQLIQVFYRPIFQDFANFVIMKMSEKKDFFSWKKYFKQVTFYIPTVILEVSDSPIILDKIVWKCCFCFYYYFIKNKRTHMMESLFSKQY